MILLIDNYDSFVHNLARHFARLGHETRVVRNDAIDSAGVRALQPAAVVLSPGPCTPAEAGVCSPLVRSIDRETPILGVCLGHQCIAAAYGARVVRASEAMHGRTSQIAHNGRGIFAGLAQPLTVCRYHSLVVDEATLPGELEITARGDDGSIMALAHRERPVVGVQFHPEAILTQQGYRLLANFLGLAGLGSGEVPSDEMPSDEMPSDEMPSDRARWPEPDGPPRPISSPVTF
jgi:anthranilate synthase/aminodeoxychorismate synthase-like glutamine amidotransferase